MSLNTTPGTRDLAATSDGRRIVYCPVKEGPIASQRCASAQAEQQCFCPNAIEALKGLELVLAPDRQIRDPEDEARRAGERVQLVSLKARAQGFERRPVAQQFAGPALRVENERRARGKRAAIDPDARVPREAPVAPPRKLVPQVVAKKAAPSPEEKPAVRQPASAVVDSAEQKRGEAAEAVLARREEAAPATAGAASASARTEPSPSAAPSTVEPTTTTALAVLAPRQATRVRCPRCDIKVYRSKLATHPLFDGGPVCGVCVIKLEATTKTPAAEQRPPLGEQLDEVLRTPAPSTTSTLPPAPSAVDRDQLEERVTTSALPESTAPAAAPSLPSSRETLGEMEARVVREVFERHGGIGTQAMADDLGVAKTTLLRRLNALGLRANGKSGVPGATPATGFSRCPKCSRPARKLTPHPDHEGGAICGACISSLGQRKKDRPPSGFAPCPTLGCKHKMQLGRGHHRCTLCRRGLTGNAAVPPPSLVAQAPAPTPAPPAGEQVDELDLIRQLLIDATPLSQAGRNYLIGRLSEAAQ